ncbi:MAG TPA: pitrilysin family protein [Kofleriaceae bacterium]|jgi:zinc protease
MKRALALLAAAACGSSSPMITVPAPPPTGPDLAPEPPQPEKPMPDKATTQTAQPQDLAFPDEEFRAHRPAAGAAHPFKLPKIARFTLHGSGIDVYLVEQHALPIVSMDLNFDGGAITDPEGKEGLASTCMAMLTEGTRKLDKIAYSEALADIASNVNAYATEDTQGVTLSTLTKHLDATFALFADTLREPGLRASDFDRLVKRRIESVKQARGNPQMIPGRVASAIVFGRDHALGAVTTEASLAAITLDDCTHYVQTWLQPKHARLFVVGDLTEAQLRDAFAKSPLGAWTGTPPPEPKPAPAKTMAGRIFFIHVPNAAQSNVSAMALGPTRLAPDYFATSMVGAVLGGSFTSRLNMKLREDMGAAYGARGGFQYSPKQFGILSTSAQVQTDETYRSLLATVQELKDLGSGARAVTSDELEREKTNAVLALPGQFATAQAALGRYRMLVYYGLPLDYYDSYVAKVQHLTDAEVKAAAAKHLKLDHAVYLVVGDGDAIVKGYEKAGQPGTLRDALVDLSKRGDVGAGGLVELDVDGNAPGSR